jgi:excinuclease UvrABC ATPase subunit
LHGTKNGLNKTGENMKDKIEQVKNIKKIVDDVFLQKITESRSWDIAERLYNALYSEPQVCPHCEGSGRFYADGKVHYAYKNAPTVACAYCNGTGKVPIPSTPASEGMLTEEIAHWLSNFYYRLNNWECSIMPKTYYDSEKPLLLKREAEALLAKCHQSEAAIRADQKGKIFDVLDPLTVGSSDSDQRELLLNAIAKLQKGDLDSK